MAAFFVGPYGLGEWHDNERQAFHIRRARIIPVLLLNDSHRHSAAGHRGFEL